MLARTPDNSGFLQGLFLRQQKSTLVGASLAQEEGFEPPWGFPQTVFKKLTAFPVSSLILPNR